MTNTITLYSLVPIDRSSRIAWMLRELDLEFTQIMLDGKSGEHRKPPYSDLNPFGAVPTLVFNDIVLTESAAILTELALRFPNSGFMLGEGSAEARAFWKWMFWAVSTLEPAGMSLIAELRRDAQSKQCGDAQAKMERLLVPLDAHLSTHDFLTGERFTIADIVTTHGLVLLQRRFPLNHYKHITSYLDRVGSRPAAIAFFEAAAEFPLAA